MKRIILLLIICMMLMVLFIYSGSDNPDEKMVEVPDVVNMKMEEAKEVLKAHGLIPVEDYGFSHEKGDGYVSDTYPEDGRPVRKGTEVKIGISGSKKIQ